MEKFCKDCKWAKRPWFNWPSYQYALCTHPDRKQMKDKDYLVTGLRTSLHCSNERDFGICGPEGKLWEAKNGNPRSTT